MGLTPEPQFPTDNATPDVLDTVIVKDFVQPVHLSVCSALSSDHLPILIDTICRTSFQNLLDRHDFPRMEWGAIQAWLEDRFLGNPEANGEGEVNKCVEELTSVIQEATVASASKRRPHHDPRPPLPASIQE
jgi:hypothetical protein